MGETQLWQSDGLGVDKGTLEKVLRIFKSDGVQGIKSQQALNAYIQKLDDSKLREMHEIDSETALQMFTDCFGVSLTARKYSQWENDILKQAIDILQKEKETAEQAAEENRKALQETRRKANEQIDALKAEGENWIRKCENAQEEARKLRETLIHYKADLYDFYAQAGKLPSYERR